MNGRQNVLKEKSFAFAIRIVRLHNYLEEKREFTLSRQLLRSGTAIGALTRESQNAESKADFIHKLAIAQKECDETIYWLELLKEAKYISSSEYKSIGTDAMELLKIIRSIILTTKKKYKASNFNS
jgi:four helix bundle protein